METMTLPQVKARLQELRAMWSDPLSEYSKTTIELMAKPLKTLQRILEEKEGQQKLL